MADEPRVAIVVPWRAGDPDRERAWTWARTWWEQFGWPVFEAPSPPGPFNRSGAINAGARMAWRWDVLVIADADTFAEDAEQVRDAVASCWETGRLTIALRTGTDLNARGTQLLLAGRSGWERQLHKNRGVCTSRIWVVREDLFETVGGFDERFRGWGFEDVAAFHSMRTLRGVDHVPGTAFHLWHVPSIGRARRSPEYDKNRRLADRYLAADRQGWPELEPILAERPPEQRWERPEGDTPPPPRLPDRGVDVICLTAGRREYLERTLASFSAHVQGDIRRRTLFDDSGDADFHTWAKGSFPEWDVVEIGARSFTGAIRAAWAHEKRRGDGAPYVFHLEEDFVFDRAVDLGEELAPVLEADAKLAQVALLRRPFFPPEIEAGGIIAEDPDAYDHRDVGGRRVLVHRKFFTTNPCLYRRSLLRFGWPSVANSETAFTRQLIRRGFSFAFLGDGEPAVSHIGAVRTMRGY